jgi:hypothetical protein
MRGGALRAALIAVALALAGCSTAASLPGRLENLDSCADSRDPAYLSMREQALEVMTEQHLDLSDTLAGLEASAKIRTIPGVLLSGEDSTFLKQHGFFSLYGGFPFSLARFAALRRCMQEKHGYTIRTIEVRAP